MKKLIIICAVMLIAAPALAAWNDVHVADANTAGLWHFDEGTGQTVYDSSGNGYDGVMIEQINGHGGDTIQMTSEESWVPSMTGFGTAISSWYESYNSNVNANTGGILVDQWGDTEGNKLDIGQGMDITMEFWMNPDNAGHSWGERILKHYTGGDYALYYGADNYITYNYYGYDETGNPLNGTNWRNVTDDYAITPGEWTHVAVVVDRYYNEFFDEVLFFYNGVFHKGYLVGACSGGDPDKNVSFFNDAWTGTTYHLRQYTGMLDEIRISTVSRYVPEPTTLSLLAVALLALRRKK
jgi:predicted ribosomally synthesized peptide with SipW-like signal peptide